MSKVKATQNKKRKRSNEFINEIDESVLNGEEEVKKDNKKDSAESKKARDFSGDLSNYLVLWKQSKLTSNPSLWKFNKVLQEWALLHCLDEEKIPSNVFKVLLPYISTVKGSSNARLVERLQGIVDRENESSKNNEDNTTPKASESELKRANRILKKLEMPESS